MKNLSDSSKKVRSCGALILPLLIILQIASSAFAHDSGVSSINLRFSGETLTIYSSYSGNDIENLNQIEKLANEAFLVEANQEKLEASNVEVVSNNSHEIVFEHIFENVPTSEITINSLLPPSLSPNHTQIVTIINNDKNEVLRQNLVGSYQVTFDLNKLNPPTNSYFYTAIIFVSLFGIILLIKRNFLNKNGEKIK